MGEIELCIDGYRLYFSKYGNTYIIMDESNSFEIRFKRVSYMDIIKNKIKYAIDNKLYIDDCFMCVDTREIFGRDDNVSSSNYFEIDRYKAFEKFIDYIKKYINGRVFIKDCNILDLLFYLLIKREVKNGK